MRAAVRAAVARHRDTRGLGLLAALGGRELAAICGAIWSTPETEIDAYLQAFPQAAGMTPVIAAPIRSQSASSNDQPNSCISGPT